MNSDNNFSLIIEKNNSFSSIAENLEEILTENSIEQIEHIEHLENVNEKLGEIQENKKLEIFRNILIDRRPHYCIINHIEEKDLINFSDSDSSGSSNIKLKLISNKKHTNKSKTDLNKSFAALHPYFRDVYKNIEFGRSLKYELKYEDWLGNLRKTLENKSHDMLENISINVNRFSDNEDGNEN